MTKAELERLARRQIADYDRSTPGTIFAEDGFSIDLNDAYRLQIAMASLRVERGERVAGFKIGCVGEATQRQLGIESPVFGHLFEGEIRPSGAALQEAEFDQLAIEGEFAVRIGSDGKPSQVFPVSELHNHVSRGPKLSAPELVGNNAIHAGIVVGDEFREPHGEVEIAVSINGKEQGRGYADPLASLAELVERLEAFELRLKPGDIALTGTPLPLYPVSAGDEITVSCPSIGELDAVVTSSPYETA